MLVKWEYCKYLLKHLECCDCCLVNSISHEQSYLFWLREIVLEKCIQKCLLIYLEFFN